MLKASVWLCEKVRKFPQMIALVKFIGLHLGHSHSTFTAHAWNSENCLRRIDVVPVCVCVCGHTRKAILAVAQL